jgi:hypothetical protein
MGSLAADNLSHKIYLISQDKISDNVNVQPMTKFVESQLVICLWNLQIKLYNHFTHLPSARLMTGPLFKAYCQLCFQTEISLKFICMVQLPDPEPKLTCGVRPTKKRKVVEAVPKEDDKTRRPQWHSSHVKLPDKLEQLHMVMLTQSAHLKVCPSGTCEYDTRQPFCILSDVYYLLKSNTQVPLNSFIFHDKFLYIFHLKGLLSFFKGCQRVPMHVYWHFIFIIPHDVGKVGPLSSGGIPAKGGGGRLNLFR